MSIISLFQELLEREPYSDAELQFHSNMDYQTKRQEFLECEEFQNLWQKKKCKRVALLMAGQVRNLDICAPSLLEFLIEANPDVNFDLFIVTQNSQCIKPRLGQGKINQYLVMKSDPEVQLKKWFGLMIKKIYIRHTFDLLIDQQNEDLTFSKKIGWGEAFLDFSKCIQICNEYTKKNSILYDSYIRLRPDLLFTQSIIVKPMPSLAVLHSSNGFSETEMFFQDVFFIFDVHCCKILANFYEFYMDLTKKSLENSFEWDHNNNAERILPKYLTNNKISIINDPIPNRCLPLSWLIAEIKQNKLQYISLLPIIWQIKLKEYSQNLVQCVFDI